VPPGIYCIENLINGKKYIGQGQDVEKRMTKSRRGSPAIGSAIKKYGIDNFKKYIILYCEKSELNYYEIESIKIFCSHISEHGYNISWGGDAPFRGMIHTDEWKAEASRRMTGKNSPRFGKKDEKASERARIYWTGRKHTEKELINMRNAQLGEKGHNYGKHPSDETIRKQSESHSGVNNVMYGKRGKDNPHFGKKQKNASSPYFGVFKTLEKGMDVWFVQFKNNEKNVRIGKFKTELDAALRYDKYIIENNIDRPLNFPDGVHSYWEIN
jgi:group I intron endonuclease